MLASVCVHACHTTASCTAAYVLMHDATCIRHMLAPVLPERAACHTPVAWLPRISQTCTCTPPSSEHALHCAARASTDGRTTPRTIASPCPLVLIDRQTIQRAPNNSPTPFPSRAPRQRARLQDQAVVRGAANLDGLAGALVQDEAALHERRHLRGAAALLTATMARQPVPMCRVCAQSSDTSRFSAWCNCQRAVSHCAQMKQGPSM